MISYFASDGNFGSAENLVVVDTEKWGFAEWTMVEEASDDERAMLASRLSGGK